MYQSVPHLRAGIRPRSWDVASHSFINPPSATEPCCLLLLFVSTCRRHNPRKQTTVGNPYINQHPAGCDYRDTQCPRGNRRYLLLSLITLWGRSQPIAIFVSQRHTSAKLHTLLQQYLVAIPRSQPCVRVYFQSIRVARLRPLAAAITHEEEEKKEKKHQTSKIY